MPKADHYAIVVGIAVYPGFERRNLEGPVNDALDFIEWLKAPEGGDLPVDNIQCLLSEQPPANLLRPSTSSAQPKAGEIDALFRPLYEQGQDAPVGERLYIFVAGHGISDRIDLRSVALLSADATPSDPIHVAMVKRAEWFRRHGAFKEIVLFADCCRDNIGFELTSPQWPERWASGPAHPRTSSARYLYGFATGYGKKAREREFGNDGTRGIFSQTLLKALREAQPDATGRVTGQRLQDHVHNIHQSVAGDLPVEPPSFDDAHEDKLVFSDVSVARTHAVQVWIQPHTGRETLVVSQNFKTVERVPSARSPQTVNLVPGLYKLEIGGSDRHQLIEVPRVDECVL